MEELEPERATPQSTAIYEDKDGGANVLMAPKTAAFVHRWDTAKQSKSVPHGQCHTRTSFNLFVCFKTFIAYSMCYCNIKLKWTSWSRSAPPHKTRQSVRTRMVEPAFSWLRRELRLFTARTRPLFWIQTEVPIFRKESCIICLGETCL